jgi:hypothetical protein
VPAGLSLGVHNIEMKPLVSAVVAVLGLSVAVAGCGGSGTSDPTAKTTQPIQARQQTAVPVPSGLTLTNYGSVLSFGQSANVAFSANSARKTILELKVISATQGSLDDFAQYNVDDATRASTPYYVEVYVKNLGFGDVGQSGIPLFLVDNLNKLIRPSSFTTTFTKCPSMQFPVSFAPQAELTTCLVYLAPDHATMTGISFRAIQKFAPILWQGAVTPVAVPTKAATKAAGKSKSP